LQSAEAYSFWGAIFLYAGAFCLLLLSAVFRKRAPGTVGTWAAVAALLLHSAAFYARWSTAGHLPVASTYELNLKGTWLGMVIFTAVGLPRGLFRNAGLVVLPVTFLLLGMGALTGPQLEPLSPAYRSRWLAVHVVFAFLAYGCFVSATGVSAALLAGRGRRPSDRAGEGGRDLDLLTYKLVAVGVVFHAVMLVSGAIWANDLWGSYWSWDPVETWSLATLLIYTLYLHLRSFSNLRGRAGAVLVIACFAALLISYWGIQYVTPSLHKFGSF